MKMIIILLIVVLVLLLVGCETNKSDIIFSNAQKVCSQNGTYCHLFRASGNVNLTFNTSGDFYYLVESS